MFLRRSLRFRLQQAILKLELLLLESSRPKWIDKYSNKASRNASPF